MNGWSFGSALRGSASSRALAIALSAPLAVAVPLSCASAGGALPSSGQYVAGSGTIAKAGKSGLTIDQSSATGIIDWNSFSIGRKNSVTFDNGSGATLNRVTGGNLSTIAGSLKATGSLYLINPQGMIVSGTGRVLTGGNFVGSSRDLSDDDFAHGKRRFTGTSKGAVVNQGTIRSSNGDVALIGSSASNSGILSASHGSASLNAGNTVLLAPAGSGGRILVSGGRGNVTNSGTIEAAQAQLDAAGGNVYALSGNNGGIVRATGTSTIGGHVWLTSNSGNVSISGTVAATNANGSGGTVEATGTNLSVGATAKIDASGTRGGTILLGGDIHGGRIAADNFVKDKLATAQTTTIAKGATITADASHGAGGNIVVWSDRHTSFAGSISATGAKGSQGGFSEVSSHDLLGFTGKVDLTAWHGKTGTLLLDPENVVIESGTTTGGSLDGGSPTNTFTPSADDSVLSVADLEAALASANVTVTTGSTGTQAGDITVLSPITWSANTLTLDAARNINIEAAVSATGSAGLTLIDADTTNTGVNDGNTADGDLSFSNGGNITFASTSEALSINGNAYTLENSISGLAADIATNSGSGYYALAGSYDASQDGTYTSAPVTTAFTGTFNGLGNTIKNLSITNTTDGTPDPVLTASDGISLTTEFLGLFAQTGTGSVIENLDLSNAQITGGDGAWIGGIVAYANGGTIHNVSLSGAINIGSIDSANGEFEAVGGVAGFIEAGTSIDHAYSSMTITATDSADEADNPASGQIGGIVGRGYGAVSYSSATGNISVGNDLDAGGLWGGARPGSSIAYSSATGNVTAGDGGVAGGLVAYLRGSVISSFATGNVTVGATDNITQSAAGGFAAVYNPTSASSLTNSYATGDVSAGAGSAVGGFAGEAVDYFGTASISNSYATGNVFGGSGSTAGGFAGYIDSTITIDRSYATGDVTNSNGFAGGFVGYIDVSGGTTIDESYSAGKVSASGGTAGGFVGDNEAGVIGGTTAVYYNASANSGLSAQGSGPGDASHIGALTSLSPSAFAGWTFGGLGSGADWVMIGANGTPLATGSSVAGGTTPMLLSEYSTTITNAHQLQLMALDLTANYTLANNIDASKTAGGDVWISGFIPVGSDTSGDSTTQFTGSFNGQGHTIGGLTIDDEVTATNKTTFETDETNDVTVNGVYDNAPIAIQGANVGLFGYVASGATVSNVGLVGGYIAGTFDVGALAGWNAGTITNAYATAQVKGVDTFGDSNGGGIVGGLVGTNNGTVTGTHAEGLVTGNFDLGGLVGYNLANDVAEGTIENSYATGAVTGVLDGGDAVGGLVGYNSGLIDNTYAEGAVSGYVLVGGLVGGNFSDSAGASATPLVPATVENSHATGTVTGEGPSSELIGGLIGQSGTGITGLAGNLTPVVLNDYASGNVSGNSTVGGLLGDANSGSVTNSFATGSVTGTGIDPYELGGLVGVLGDQGGVGTTVTGSFATGDVTGSDTVGGLVGYMKGGDTIADSYATGAVTATDPTDGYDVGGLVGYARGMIIDSYATGGVTGNGYVGGLVGELGFTITNTLNSIFNNTEGSVTQSYSSGAVQDGPAVSGPIGAFVGGRDRTSTVIPIISADFFNSQHNAGLTGLGTNAAATGMTGLDDADMMNSSKFTGWTFGTTGGGSGWVIVDQDGSLNNASGAAGGTTPMLLSEYSTTITNAHQLQLMELDPTASYTLANDIDASGTAGGDVWGGQGFIAVGGNNSSGNFTGTFDGQDHTISGLFINDATNSDVGLFGEADGTVRDVGLVNANVTGTATGGLSDSVGGLAGENDGEIAQSYATGTVTGGDGDYVGGLTGFNLGTITQSYATGAVTGGDDSNVGGLVGFNNATIAQSYATGTVVTGGSAFAGGLVGQNLDDITQSYATGAVTGGDDSLLGGFAGYNAGSIDASYALGAATGGSHDGGLVGENEGTAGATTAVYFNSDANPGGGIGEGTAIANGGGLTRAQMESTASFVGWTFGGLGSGADWVIVDQDGSLNNANSATGGTTPMLLSEYSATITNAHQLQLMALDPTASYMLAGDIDASGTAGGDVWDTQGFIPVGGNNASGDFTGTLDGHNHTIGGLYINDTTVVSQSEDGGLASDSGEIGLFGGVGAGGVLQNVNLTKADVSGGDNTAVGIAAGLLEGLVSGVSTDGSVTTDNGFAGNNRSAAGGVVGIVDRNGVVAASSSNATVQAGDTANAGGLVGVMQYGGVVSNSNASGDVTVGGNTIGDDPTNDVYASSAGGGLIGMIYERPDIYGTVSTVSDSYATGTVTGGMASTPPAGSGNTWIGGLIGVVLGTGNAGAVIEDTYATGQVTGGASGVAGGLIGTLASRVSVTDSYATGNVNVGDGTHAYYATAGGLIGYDATGASVDQSYATGNVGGGVAALLGGFVGYNDGGAVSNSYALGNVSYVQSTGTFDTTGYSNIDFEGGFVGWNASSGSISNAYSVGDVIPTFALQGGFAGDNDGTISHSYFDTQTSGFGIANGVGAVNFGGVTNGAGVTGKTTSQLQSALPSGFDSAVWSIQTGLSFPYLNWQAVNGTPVFVSGVASSNEAGTAALADAGIDAVVGGEQVSATTSGANGYYYFMLAPNTGSSGGIGVYYSTPSLSGRSFEDVSNGASVANLNIDNNLLNIQTADGSTSSLNSAITATFGSILGNPSATAFTDYTDSSVHDIAIAASGTFAVDQAISATQGNLSLSVTAGDLALEANVSDAGHTLTLASDDTISQSGGIITAGTLTGSATHSVTLNDNNAISNLGNFASTTGFTLTDTHALNISGFLNAGTGTGTSVVTLNVTGGTNGITESGGKITAASLVATSAGAIALNGANNSIANLGNITSLNGLSLTDAHALLITGAVNAGSSTVDLVTTGGTNGITGAGKITAGTLTGSAAGAVSLDATANAIANLGAFANAGGFLLDDAHALNIDGFVNAGSGTLTLNITGSGNGLTDSGSGKITAGTLTGSAAGAVALNDAGYLISNLGAFSATSGFALTNGEALNIDGFLNAGSSTVDLINTGAITDSGAGKITAGTLTGSAAGAVALNDAGYLISNLGAFSATSGFALTNGHALTIDGFLNAGSGTVDLVNTGTIGESGSGKITAGTLTGSSVGGATLNGANLIGVLSTFTNSGAGGLALTDGQTLTVSGVVNAGTGNLALTTTGAGHNLAITNALTTTGTATLTSAGTIGETGSGKLTAGTLTGSSVGGTTLNGANLIGVLSTFTNSGAGGLALTDGQTLTVSGVVNAGTGNLALTTTGAGHNLAITNALTTTGTATLTSAGTIGETGSGKLTAGTLTGSSVGGTTLNGANLIGVLSTFTNSGAGGLALTDGQTLTVSGVVNAGTGNLALTTTGAGHNLAITNALTTTGTATLTSAGTIGETGSGKLTAGTLTGSSVGGTTLNGANLVATLGNFANTGAGNFSFVDGKALNVSGLVSVASTTGTLGLTTTSGNLTISGTLTGPTVTLTSAGEILEGTAGDVTATNTLNVSAATGIDLNSTHNHIKKVGTRHTNSGPNVINGIGM